MKLILFMLFLSFYSHAHRFDTGQFEITKTNFSELFNNYRFSSPENIPWAGNFFPYSLNGTAVKLNANGDTDPSGRSPLEAYIQISENSDDILDWEKQHHSCKKLTGDLKKSCQDWWGHCNGWAAAAIKEQEPRNSKKINFREVSVADQKGLLSELWLSSYSLNAGLTEKNIKTQNWVYDHDNKSDAYKKFWDITPRAFFLILTNYLGAMKTGVVIDRFTGDEVWNQPLVGYRILPIRSEDITKINDQGYTYWSAWIRIKIFWANDIGLSYGHVSKPFKIDKTKDSEELEDLSEDYQGRILAFRLFFDQEIKIDSSGTKITNAGKIVGEGVWDHQENSLDYTLDEINHTHPDFMWIPTQVFQDQTGYGNPFIDEEIVNNILSSTNLSPRKKGPFELNVIFSDSLFKGQALDPIKTMKKIKSILRRESIKHNIKPEDVVFQSGIVRVKITFPFWIDTSYLSNLFLSAELPFKIDS